MPSPSLSRVRSALPVALAAAVAAACSSKPAPVYQDPAGDAVPGQISVELRGAVPAHRAFLSTLGRVLDEQVFEEDDEDFFLPRDRFAESVFLLETGDAGRTAAALQVLRARPDVVFAEPVVKLHALSWEPNDPGFQKQWHLKAAGAPQAWEAARGQGVTVAVLDTGVAPLDDLDQARLLEGHNFVPGGKSDDAVDDHGHGTHVAGTIAQATDNGKGVAGMAPRAKILPLKVLGADGSGTSAGIADAIRYAADHGAQVLNLSLGGGARSEAMAYAVAYARRKGCLVVCAAGNEGVRHVSYPAAYPGATAVSAVGPQGSIAPYSSFGPEVALAAPGGDKSQGEEAGVLQQTIGEDGQPAYRWFQGTSMATPHVAGAAALLYSVGVTNPSAVQALLQSTAHEGRSLSGASSTDLYGAGVLDAGGAVRTATFWWGLSRLLLAVAGAAFALAHARKLGQIRPLNMPGAEFWAALLLTSGGMAALAPAGLARVPIASLFAVPPAALSFPLLGAPGSNLAASIAGWLAFSAVVPFVLAMVARGLSRSHSPSSGFFGALVAGLCFGQAGLLLHTALVNSVHLPLLPSFLGPVWFLAGALVSWGAGRGLLAREAVR
jgi:serine protease